MTTVKTDKVESSTSADLTLQSSTGKKLNLKQENLAQNLHYLVLMEQMAINYKQMEVVT